MLKDIDRRIVPQEALTKTELAPQLEVSLTAVSDCVTQPAGTGLDRSSTGSRYALAFGHFHICREGCAYLRRP